MTFKKTKRRVKKIRKKEKEVIMRADDLLPLGDQTQDGDFGSRWAGRRLGVGLGRPWGQRHREASTRRLRGRGRRRVPEADEEPQEEGEKEPVPQPPPSDDTRVENMDISDEGEGPACGVGVGPEGPGQEPGFGLSGRLLCLPQRRAPRRALGPQRCWRRTRPSWSCRSSWRRGAACGSCSSSGTAARR